MEKVNSNSDQNSIKRDVLTFIVSFSCSYIFPIILLGLVNGIIGLMPESIAVNLSTVSLVIQAIVIVLYFILIYYYLRKKKTYVALGIGMATFFKTLNFIVAIMKLIAGLITSKLI